LRNEIVLVQESINAAPKHRLPVEQEVVPALPCPAMRANGLLLLRNTNKASALRYIDSKIPVRSVQSLHDRKESAVVDDLSGASGAMFTGAIQKVALTALITLCISAPSFAASGQSITFDAPGAGTAANLGTFPDDINDLGQVVGYFIDGQGFYHGFVRYPDGRLKVIDAPGGGTVPASGQGTVLLAINNEGTIVGQYQDDNFAFHCFVLGQDCRFITFEAPGAGSGQNQGGEVCTTNSEGTTTNWRSFLTNIWRHQVLEIGQTHHSFRLR
jgi:probable HAF family extracellular repeat protein